jgi:hypothetical protein
MPIMAKHLSAWIGLCQLALWSGLVVSSHHGDQALRKAA